MLSTDQLSSMYVARSSALCKVGHSWQPGRRVRDLRCPRTGERPVLLLAVELPWPMAHRAERAVQRALWPVLAGHGREWFVWHDEILDSIDNVLASRDKTGEVFLMASMRAQLRTKRIERDLTQEQAASDIGISQEMLVQIENGKRNPSQATTDKISRWLSSPGKRTRSARGPYNKDRTTIPGAK